MFIRRPKSKKIKFVKKEKKNSMEGFNSNCLLSVVSEDMECSSFHCRPAPQYPQVLERKQVNYYIRSACAAGTAGKSESILLILPRSISQDI